MVSKSTQKRHSNSTKDAKAENLEAAETLGLRLRIGEEKLFVTPETIGNSDSRDVLLTRIANAKDAKLSVDRLPLWPKPDAECLITLLANCPTTLKFVVAKTRVPSPSAAIVLLLKQEQGAAEQNGLLGHLKLAIALGAIDQSASAADAKVLREAYRAIEREVPTVATLKSAINKVREELLATATPHSANGELLELFPQQSVVSTLMIPPGYEVSKDGIRRRGKLISKSPILIIGLVQMNQQSLEKWQIAVYRDGEVRFDEFPATELLQTRTVIQLAGLSADLTSETAKFVVRWLRDFRNANADRLPRLRGTSQLGHYQLRSAVGGSHSAFVLGDQVVTADEGTAGKEQIKFVHPDDGDADWAEKWHSRGEFAAWQKVVEPALKRPVVRFAVLASLATSLLNILNVDNFLVSLACTSGHGKTTVLQMAASVWGVPKTRGGILKTWKTTEVGIERALGMLNGVPFIVDETTLARQAGVDVGSVGYMVVEGQTKSRGTLRGQAVAQRFATILITSGEASFVKMCRHQGILARVAELRIEPFGPTSEDSRGMIETLNVGLEENYGTLGPEFVRYLIRNEEKWPQWKARYRELAAEECAALGPKAEGRAYRLAQSLAVIRLTAELVQDAFDSTKFLSDPVPVLRNRINAVGDVEDKFAALREKVLQAVHQNRARFPYRGELKRTPMEFDGAISEKGDVVFYLPESFKGIVEADDDGLSVDSVLDEFAKRGWIVMEPAASGKAGPNADGKKRQRRFKVDRVMGRDQIEVVAVRVPKGQRFGSYDETATPKQSIVASKKATDNDARWSKKTIKS